MSQIPVATDKRYTAEELSPNTYYMMGSEKCYKLIRKTDKIVELYPNTISKIYHFEVINIKTGHIEVTDVILNPAYHCFSDVCKNDIQNSIYDLENHANKLKAILY